LPTAPMSPSRTDAAWRTDSSLRWVHMSALPSPETGERLCTAKVGGSNPLRLFRLPGPDSGLVELRSSRVSLIPQQPRDSMQRVHGFRESMRGAAANANDWRRLGARGRAAGLEWRTWRTVIKQYDELYKGLCAETAG